MRSFHPLISAGHHGFVSPVIPDVNASLTPDEIKQLELDSMPIVNVDQRVGHEIEITCSFPGYFSCPDHLMINSQNVDFTQVNIPGVGYLNSGGRPLLPSFGRYLRIPGGMEYEDFRVETYPIAFEIQDVNVLPVQNHLFDQNGTTQVSYDAALYNSNEPYPENVVCVSGPHNILSINSLLLHIRPFQYRPADRALVAYEMIKLIMIFRKGKDSVGLTISDPANRPGTLLADKFFLNPPDSADKDSFLPIADIPWLPFKLKFEYGRPELFIFCGTEYYGEAKRLAVWKAKLGLPAAVIPVDQKKADVDWLKRLIRLEKRSIFSKLQYVLFVGDIDSLPGISVSQSPYDPNLTDYYYSTEEDPSSSTEIVFPNLAIGRIPVRDVEQAKNVIDKIIDYEKYPAGRPGYYREMTFAAYFEDEDSETSNRDGQEDRCFVKTMEDIREHLSTYCGFTGNLIQRVYTSNSPLAQLYRDSSEVDPQVVSSFMTGSNATQAIESAIKDGKLIIAHRGHGTYAGWVSPHFHTDNLHESSGKDPSIFFSINCRTGEFDCQYSLDSDELICLAEALLRLPQGGAASVIAATRDSNTWLNDDLMKGLFDAIWNKLLPFYPENGELGSSQDQLTPLRLGDILNYAKLYLPLRRSVEELGGPGAYDDNSYLKDHFEIYHVIGDPTLLVRTPNTVVFPPVIDRYEHYTQVSPTEGEKWPAGSIVTAWEGDRLLYKASPSSEERTLKLIHLKGQKPQICFWAPGHNFFSDPMQK